MAALGQTAAFAAWLRDLDDRAARTGILLALDRLALGDRGAVAPAAEGVEALEAGGSARVYLGRHDGRPVALTGGIDPRTRSQDVRTAQKFAQGLATPTITGWCAAPLLTDRAAVANYLGGAIAAGDPALVARALDAVAACPAVDRAILDVALSADGRRAFAAAAASARALGLRLGLTAE